MIVKSSDNPEIGKVFCFGWQLNLMNGRVYNNIPVYVIRETTREEFLEYSSRENYPIGIILKTDKFYEISVD